MRTLVFPLNKRAASYMDYGSETLNQTLKAVYILNKATLYAEKEYTVAEVEGSFPILEEFRTKVLEPLHRR